MRQSLIRSILFGGFFLLTIPVAKAGGSYPVFGTPCEIDGSTTCKFSDYSSDAYLAKVESLKSEFCHPANACAAAQEECEQLLAQDVQANCSQQAFDSVHPEGWYVCKDDTYNFFFVSPGKYKSFILQLLDKDCQAPTDKDAGTSQPAVDQACYDHEALTCYQKKSDCDQIQGDKNCDEQLKLCLDQATKSCPVKGDASKAVVPQASDKADHATGGGCSLNPVSQGNADLFPAALMLLGSIVMVITKLKRVLSR